MSNFIASCPQRKIVTVHHTIATWLPITLECGHTERVNWTAREGQMTGCTECAKNQEAHKRPFRLYSSQTGDSFGTIEAISEDDAVDQFAKRQKFESRQAMWRAGRFEYVSATAA